MSSGPVGGLAVVRETGRDVSNRRPGFTIDIDRLRYCSSFVVVRVTVLALVLALMFETGCSPARPHIPSFRRCSRSSPAALRVIGDGDGDGDVIGQESGHLQILDSRPL